MSTDALATWDNYLLLLEVELPGWAASKSRR